MQEMPQPQRSSSPRRLFAVAALAAVAAFILTLSFGYADHEPAPHGVRIAVAAPSAFTHELAPGWRTRIRAASRW